MAKLADDLEALSFDTRLGQDTITADLRPELRGLAQSKEKVLEKIITKTWFPTQNRLCLIAAKGAGAKPDVLLTRYLVNASITELVVSEKRATLTILFSQEENIKQIAKQEDCESVCRHWLSQVLQLSENQRKGKLLVEPRGGFYVAVWLLHEENGIDRRYIAYTWAESIGIAIDRNGKWISISLDYNLSAMGGMPAGGFVRMKGSWFDDYVTGFKRRREGVVNDIKKK